MAFWGVALKPGQTKGVDSPQGDIMHLSQACLHEPKDGKNYVLAKVKGQSYSLACLEKGKKEHDNFDLFFSSADCTFTNKGQSDVHLTGYFEPDGMDDAGSEEEAAPPGKSPKAAVATSPKKSPAVAASSPKKPAVPEDDSDLDDEEGEESEMLDFPEDEESEEEPTKAAAKADSDDDDMEDEESEEEAPPPAKKAKTGIPGSPKKAASPEDAWVQMLYEYLKKNGKKSFGDMGTAVPRPADVPKQKLRALFGKYQAKFALNGEMVSAK